MVWQNVGYFQAAELLTGGKIFRDKRQDLKQQNDGADIALTESRIFWAVQFGAYRNRQLLGDAVMECNAKSSIMVSSKFQKVS